MGKQESEHIWTAARRRQWSSDFAADDFDFDAAIAAEDDPKERHRLTQASVLQGRARTHALTLKQVWAALPLSNLAAA